MSSSDWEEIKRLAADFQRAQLTSSLQRLSERNCIEIIGKLVELRLIDIHHTNDGKEYITPSQLDKEIVDELFVSGGRLNLTELCGILQVDLGLIEKRAAHIANVDQKLHLILGQLISEDYLDLIAEEVNEKLQQDGSITVGDVARLYDLPGSFVFQAIVDRLGSIIYGLQDTGDPETIFTEAFVERHQAQVRGVLSAITQPTSVSKILTIFSFQEKLFFSVAEKLISNKQIRGKLSSSGRQASQSVYTPDIYSQGQYDWVNNFFKQNGYLDYESLNRLGISDAESYIKRNFSNVKTWFVSGACVGELFMGQIEANMEDAIANGSMVDIAPFLPSQFSPEVCSELIDLCMENQQKPFSGNDKKSGKDRNSSERMQKGAAPKCHIFNDTFIISDTLLTKARLKLEERMPKRAEEEITRGAFKQQLSKGKLKDDESSRHKKDDRRKKAAGGKQGGGTQGRETKTKSTKNKHKGRKGRDDSDSEDDSVESSQSQRTVNLEFLSIEDLQKELAKNDDLQEAPEEVLEEIASHMVEELNQKFNQLTRETYMKLMQGGGSGRKQNHKQMQEKIISLATTVKLAERSLKHFEHDTDLHTQLSKFLLKTHCSEILNDILIYLAHDSEIDIPGTTDLTVETRLKIIRQLSDDVKETLTSTHKSLGLASVEEFLSSLETTVSTADIFWKIKDNKKDKQFLQQHRMCLLEQLSASMDPALTLHLTCLLVFLAVTSGLLHASGKFVPQILSSLRKDLSTDSYILLAEFQGLVMQNLTLKSDDPELSETKKRLEELEGKVKEFGVTFKKGKARDGAEENSNT